MMFWQRKIQWKVILLLYVLGGCITTQAKELVIATTLAPEAVQYLIDEWHKQPNAKPVITLNRTSTSLNQLFMTEREKEVDLISLKLKKYDEGKIDVAQLLGFEENNIVTVIEIISLLHANKDKYDKTKSFNSNLPIILNLRGDTIGRTIEDKEKFIKTLVERDKSKTLSEFIWQGIFTFQEIYGYEMKLINQE